VGIDSLLNPVDLGGALQLRNRVVMLGMTRARAEIDGTPNELMVEYYAQRAEAGLIISESCAVAPTGRCFMNSPGMYTAEHAIGWRRVVDAVHAKGGKIILQINHVGRANNLQYLPRPIPPVAPSAIRIPRFSRNISINIPRVTPFEVPTALTTDEVGLVVKDFARATDLAVWAGFDGVEIHADSGYLIHQFLSTNVNQRTDKYGGSPRNRARFALEVFDAVTAVNGANYVSIKLTPGSPISDIIEDDIDEKYDYLISALNERDDFAFVHFYFADILTSNIYQRLTKLHRGRTLSEGSLTVADYCQLVDSGITDLIGFARSFIGNPDLVHRLREGYPLSGSDPETIYSPTAEGYTDYPFWDPRDPAGSVVHVGKDDQNALLRKQVV
jgi:2,4-dienoyl-CoA reductase-like NADH-dependent reductase (Old Yellow Enzyme family)